MKKLVVFCLAVICLLTVTSQNPARAAGGYWTLSASYLENSEAADGEYWDSSVSAVGNAATFTTRGAQNEYEKASTSWTAPPGRIDPDAPFELSLSAKVDALTNRDSSHTIITSFFDAPGLVMGTDTGARAYLTDSSGYYSCETLTESVSITVSGSLGSGSARGEQTALYVVSYNNGMLVQGQYVYQWITKSEEVIKDSGTRFTSISGTVEIASEEQYQLGQWGYAKLDMVLNVGDHIRTGEESSCILSFADLSCFVMQEETHIILNAPPDRDDKIALVWGKIKANIKKMMKDGSMEIDMSQGVCGIKGTTFVCEEDGETSTLKVFEGTVEFTSKATGDSVMVGAGQKASADDTGLSEVTDFDTDAGEEEWAEIEAAGGAEDAAAEVTPEPDMDYGINPLLIIGLLIIVLIIVAAVVVILAVNGRKKARRNAAPVMAPPHAPPMNQTGFCAACGAPLRPDAGFCQNCGKRR
jgi:hypothetical protein